MRIYMLVTFIFLGALSYEYYALNKQPRNSILHQLQSKGKIAFKPDPEPGRPMSLWLGWGGLGLMVVMNVYSMRKRFSFMKNWGRMSSWMNFHIFCGLLGPVFILFHSNFKVRGLVAISFWSMVISFSSGIVGRYFFLQLSSRKADFDELGEKWIERLRRFLAKVKIEWQDGEVHEYLNRALHLAGAPIDEFQSISPVGAISRSFIGDLKMLFRSPDRPAHWPQATVIPLKEYAVAKRRAALVGSFQQLMGYWHAFHFPFAVFMYLTAIVHVIAALVFGL